MPKHWFSFTGAAGTGKTTLMYETVACLRELSIEAVGVTERVRLMPKVTHKELCSDPYLHVSLMESQLFIETELAGRDETQVVLLDRCLLDYLVLAELTFPDFDFRRVLKEEILAGRTIDEYLSRFDLLIVPASLSIGDGESAKVRPDEDFRLRSTEAFDDCFKSLPAVLASKVLKIDNSVPLRDRCTYATDYVLSAMGRSSVFRNYYKLSEIARTLVALGKLASINIDKIWVSGTRCKSSPTFPSYGSDVDLFVSGSFAGGRDMTTSIVLGEDWAAAFVHRAEKMIKAILGATVYITTVTPELAEAVTLKELLWQTEQQENL